LIKGHRYFEGIQGDNAKKGELFGINNIFKLHEDKLATKMAVCTFLLLTSPSESWSIIQIEKANLAELDWALANMDAGSRGKKQVKPTSELVEADAKVGKDDVCILITPSISFRLGVSRCLNISMF